MLNKLVSHYCHLWEGQTFHILANELVPGNIITFAMGKHIPIDIRIVLTVDLEVDESSPSCLWSTHPLGSPNSGTLTQQQL
jgi:Ca2+-transporting ATPase